MLVVWSHSFALKHLNEKIGYYNLKGKLLLKPQDNYILEIQSKVVRRGKRKYYAIVGKSFKRGIMSFDGRNKEIVPLEYSRIIIYGRGMCS